MQIRLKTEFDEKSSVVYSLKKIEPMVLAHMQHMLLSLYLIVN
jgi:hypothetical protein